jgi:predicted TIM-barrel fold metal-dependent hydrolase
MSKEIIKTIDIHTHLLSSDVKFDRIYDKLALMFFGKKMGLDLDKVKQDPYGAYVDALIGNVVSSEHIEKIVLFGVDAKIGLDGVEIDRDMSVCASNDDVLSIYQKHPDIIVPFFSINPNRADALDLIDRYVELGFKGAKFLQNYWAIDLGDDRYKPYFQKLAKLDLPLIVHTGSENSISSVKEYESIKMLEAPLRCGVKVIAAHMALEYSLKNIYKAISNNPKYFNKEYFLLLEMLEIHENLYADISALLTPFRAKALRDLSQREQIHHKLLFGSDFPVPTTTLFSSYDLSLAKRFALSKIQNPFDRYAKSILEYFDATNPIYTNHKKLLD